MTERAGKPKGAGKRKRPESGFAERLRQLKNKLELSQEQIAESAGVSPPTVSGWMSGKRLPSGGDLARLSRVFGCSIDWLLLGQAANRDDIDAAAQNLRADWQEMTEVVVAFALEEVVRSRAVAALRKRRGEHAGEGWETECHRAGMEAAAAALTPQALVKVASGAYVAAFERERLECEAAELTFHRRMAQVRSVERQTGREQPKMRSHAEAPVRAKRFKPPR
jgi:transcriptional regulator with XRE-family HTH domain